MTLRTCPRGARVVISHVSLDDRHRFRLAELGLNTGTELHVTQRSVFGGRVVACGSERLAVDGATAGAIEVQPVTGNGTAAVKGARA